MKTSKLSNGILVAVALIFFGARSANSQGYVSFDAADSDVGAGLYYFDLTGVDTSQLVGSPFALSGFSAIGNTQTLGSVLSPSGWHDFPYNDTDQALYQRNPLSTIYNGLFEISATPNLTGTIDWSFGDVGGIPLSGTATIASVPEPSSVALIIVASSLLIIRRLYSTMWPNKSPEPTAVGAGRSAIAVHVAGRRWLSFLR